MRLLGRYLLCLGFVAIVTTANAQSWPSRPISLMVPTGPGTATDIMARLIADRLSQRLEKPVVVDNRPGASGIIAHQVVARAAADGHTLLFTGTSGLAVNPVTFKRLPYDPVADFIPVALVTSLGPQMLSVNAELPVSTLAEFVQYAKANRGKLSLGFDSTAGTAAFAVKLLNRRSDLDLIEVAYRSAAQVAQDIASGNIQLMISSIAAARSVVDAGKVRALAVTSEKRFPGLPDLPTLDEAIPGVVVNGWFAIVTPTGTPPDIVARLNRELSGSLEGPDIKEKILSFGLASEGASTPAAALEFIRRDQDRWRDLARRLDIQPQ